MMHPPQRHVWITRRVNLARKGRGGGSFLAALADFARSVVALYNRAPDHALCAYLAVYGPCLLRWGDSCTLSYASCHDDDG